MINQTTEDRAAVIRHDGSLAIATATNRKSTQYNNVTKQWSEIVTLLSTTKRTPETLNEYKNFPKSRQDEIKDVGGFVGGSLKGGRRLAEAVANRQLVTLDADYPTNIDLWQTFTSALQCGGLMYSTHKHDAKNPRLRLVIPMSRPVFADEYQPIARRIAEWLGIEQFDDTTYQSHRLMYFPSTSIDGEFVFKLHDAPWIDVDYILGTYPDWRDSSYWAQSSRQSAQLKRFADKQGDPTEKPGVIGSFCRVYDIASAIATFIPDVYSPVDGTRFTFVGGSTTGGLVLYEDKFAYSHHGSDPTSGQLVNSFDLVRIHLFGEDDQDINPDTPIIKRPSYLRMQELATKDDGVKIEIATARMEQARQAFGELPYSPQSETHAAEPSPGTIATPEFASPAPAPMYVNDRVADSDNLWTLQLEINKNGRNLETINNVFVILAFDPLIKGTFGYNEFTGRVCIRKPLPWRRNIKPGEVWTDIDDADLRHWLEMTHKLTHRGNIENAWISISRRNSFHPVREFLEGAVWDGHKRIGNLLVDYLGAEPTDYVRAVSTKTLVAAVARIMTPGCKFDYMLTLVGKQGIGKSTLFRTLTGDWYSDSMHTVQGKEAYEQLRGTWVMEMAELAVAKKSEVESMKNFITKQVDSYRAAYAHHTEVVNRQNIFIGTTNDYEFLRDKTGNRRFWIVEVGKYPTTKDLLNEGISGNEVVQIWAEAVHLWRQGEELLLRGELASQAEVIQSSHVEDNALKGMIEQFLDFRITEDWYDLPIVTRRSYIQSYTDTDALPPVPRGNVIRNRVCAIEIWCELMEGSKGKLNTQEMRNINDVLRRLEGWELHVSSTGRLRFGSEYGAQKAYMRGF